MGKKYTEMTNSELEQEQKKLQETFNEYHTILKEVYDNMYELAEKNDEITSILQERNGK
jgi:hypothetical protein